MKRSKEFLGSVRNQIMLLMCVFFCSGLVLLCIATDRYLFSEEKQQAAGIIGLAALKYGDLSNQATKDYIFDL